MHPLTTIPQYKLGCFGNRSPVSISQCRCALAKFVLRMHRNCYFRASGQSYDTAVGRGDPDFLYGTNRPIMAIGGHFDSLTVDTCSVSAVK